MVEVIDAALAAGRTPQLAREVAGNAADMPEDADTILSSDLSNMALAISSFLASQSQSPQVTPPSLCSRPSLC